MKRIGLLVPRLTNGGAERVVSRLSYIMREKYDVYIILFESSGMDYHSDGIVIDMNLPPQKGMGRKFVFFIKRILKLRRIKKQYQIETTISFLNSANFVNILSRRNDKIIISIRNYLSTELKKGLYNHIHLIIGKLFYKSADAVITVSKKIAMDMVTNFDINEDKIFTIYNPFDIESIREMSAIEVDEDIKGFIKDKRVVVTVGRLSYQKGFWHLLKAFKIVKESITDAGLIIVGNGLLDEKLKTLARELGIQKDVYFAGYRKNIFPVVSKADLYVMSSLFEGFPNALVEAMACGLPVISPDCESGPHEILCGESEMDTFIETVYFANYGVLVPPLNNCENYDPLHLEPEEMMLAQSIVELLKNKTLNEEKRTASIKRASDFSYEKCFSEINNLLDKLTGG